MTATVIDRMVLALGLDPSGYKKGREQVARDNKKLREDAKATAEDLEAKGKQAAAFFSKIKKEVLGLATVLVGGYGLTSFVEHLTSGDAAVGRLAKNLNMSTEDLSAWTGVVKRVGGSADDMAGSLKGLNGIMQEWWLTGTTKAIPFLAAADVNLRKFHSSSTSMTERMLMLADAFHKMTPGKAQQLGAALGLDYNTINLLEQGRAAVQKLLDHQRKLNVLSQRDVRLAKERQKAWYDLTDTFTRLGRTLLNDISDPLVKIVREVGQWTLKNRQWLETGFVESVRDLAAFLKSIPWRQIAQRLADFAHNANDVAQEFGGWHRVMEAIFGLWLGAKFVRLLANVRQLIGLTTTASTGLMKAIPAPIAAVAGAGYMLFHSSDLNAGEDEELAKNRNSAFALAHRLPKVTPGMTAAGPGNVTNQSSMDIHINNMSVQVPDGKAETFTNNLRLSIGRHAMASQADTGLR